MEVVVLDALLAVDVGVIVALIAMELE